MGTNKLLWDTRKAVWGGGGGGHNEMYPIYTLAYPGGIENNTRSHLRPGQMEMLVFNLHLNLQLCLARTLHALVLNCDNFHSLWLRTPTPRNFQSLLWVDGMDIF